MEGGLSVNWRTALPVSGEVDEGSGSFQEACRKASLRFD